MRLTPAERQKRYRKNHPEKVRKSIADWKARNPDWVRNRSRKRTLAKFGITEEQYADILTSQNNRCAICKSPDPCGNNDRYVNWPIDHDHTTGEARGLLCGPCNRYLGYLETHSLLSNVPTFDSYVQNPPARVVLKREALVEDIANPKPSHLRLVK